MHARRRGQHRTSALTGLALGTVLVAGCSGGTTGSAGSSTSPAPAPTPQVASTTPAPPPSSSTGSAAPSRSTASSSSAGPSTPHRVKRVTSRAADFSVALPRKWVDISDRFTDLHEVRLALRAPRRSHGSYPNIAVSGSAEHYSGTAARAAKQSAEQFRQHGAQVTDAPGLTIDGESAAGYRMLRTENATKVVQVQYFVVHDHRLYSPTGTAAPEDERDITRALRSVLASWQWS